MKPILLSLLLVLTACTQRTEDATPASPAASAPASTPGDEAPATPPAAARADVAGAASSAARADGYAGATIGMTEAQVREAWAGALRGDGGPLAQCGYLIPEQAKNGAEFGLMFEDGKFVRYDVGTADIAAPGGGRVGMARAEIDALYPGRIEVRPHHYVEGGHYLRVTAPDAAGVLVFETDEDGRVTTWRAGQPPQVDYIEGCA